MARSERGLERGPPPTASLERVRREYLLTTEEGRFALLIASGASLQEAAKALRLRPAQARWLLVLTSDKILSREPELMALLSRRRQTA